MSEDIVFRSHRVVTPEGEQECCVLVQNGVIAEFLPYDETFAETKVVDLKTAALLPGMIDTHVHLNQPGRTEWEGFDNGTRAAAAGGITTIVDMPLNSVPATTTESAFETKRAAARSRCHVNIGFWGGMVANNERELAPMWHAGALGFKCFLPPSGVPEFGHMSSADLVRMLPAVAALGAPLLVHAELPDHLNDAPPGDPRAYATWLAARPEAAEVEAVKLLVELCRDTRVRMHVVHVSSAEVLAVLRAAKAEQLPITAETCPHYLHYAAEMIEDGQTEFKVAPPIRSGRNRDRLWKGLAAGDLDMIASDHSPAPPALKRPASGSFLEAWGGIASLQLALPAVWTEAKARGYSLHQMAEWMSAAPARLAGVPKKGSIAVGMDADVIIFDPDAELTVKGSSLHHRHALTPYEGERLSGIVRSTYLRGEQVYDASRGHGAPRGRVIERAVAGEE